MKTVNNHTKSQENTESFVKYKWEWWPLLPLYPYGQKRTLFKELIPQQVWCLEQLQGLYYVAVPVRMTVVKVNGGLMLVNPLPPTPELLEKLYLLEEAQGPVLSIVLPTASGLEHKISLPALSRSFPNAEVWICPGQWSFPLNLPLNWLGIPSGRTKIIEKDGFPHSDSCTWISLGPLDIGLGRFQEFSCFHKGSKSLLVTDALVSISQTPPDLFDLDPTPLLFHSRDRGDQPLIDDPENRQKGWLRLVLFASFLRPEKLAIPPLIDVFRYAFKPGLRTFKSHFGFFPFSWQEGWQESAKELIGKQQSTIQIAPVLERLVFPRGKGVLLSWLDKLSSLNGMRWMISAHYSAPVRFTSKQANTLKNKISTRPWAIGKGNWQFLDSLDKSLLRIGVVPKDPQSGFKD